MSDEEEKMNVEKVVGLLRQALRLQFRSVLVYTWAAGSSTGIEFEAVSRRLDGFSRAELDDARRLVEKLVTLGGDAPTDVAGFDAIEPSATGLRKIIDYETEVLDALRAIIPESGNEAASEALEHLLEHLILRKQEQVDFLTRLVR